MLWTAKATFVPVNVFPFHFRLNFQWPGSGIRIKDIILLNFS